MFKTRLLSGILLVIIALITIISGGNILFGTVLVISLIGLSELYKVFKIEKKPLGICGYLFTIGYYALLYMSSLLSKGNHDWFMMLFLGYLICLMAIMVFAYPTYHADQLMAAYFGLFYVAVMLSYIYQIRIGVGGVFKVWLVFICAWGCDTFAYFTGKTIGKHKLTPVLSPKKTIEGSIGGVIGAGILGYIYTVIFTHYGALAIRGHIMWVVGAVMLGAVISQFGDLAASAVKRFYNQKDYGYILPGHGGILDRFDSFLFVAPIIYIVASMVQKMI